MNTPVTIKDVHAARKVLHGYAAYLEARLIRALANKRMFRIPKRVKEQSLTHQAYWLQCYCGRKFSQLMKQPVFSVDNYPYRIAFSLAREYLDFHRVIRSLVCGYDVLERINSLTKHES